MWSSINYNRLKSVSNGFVGLRTKRMGQEQNVRNSKNFNRLKSVSIGFVGSRALYRLT